MRKIVLLTAVFMIAQNFLFAQTYTVTYEKEQKPDLGGQLGLIKDPALRKQLESRVITTPYQLLHKDGFSNFVVKEDTENEAGDQTLALESAQTKANVRVVKVGANKASSVVYKDMANKVYLKSSNLAGKGFLIKDTLEDYSWKLTEETKTVGNYVCKKAVTVDNGNEITAWYAPSIPINDGPDEYYGLPGLIIELTDGNITYNALSVQETPDISIVKPDKGKEITRAAYQELKKERIEAIKQQFNN
ncbi:GLPGLI family protein [Flagellimonas taeanensis]|uniref:GLPGLI family protein n=1 Tax=Flagellimonas taeanensis TaxID=1005926 RepID=A0A1M6SGH7_9FLAO|nr:GLPGLI family protein [Allomuricauda taeanensis]SFB80670.1 GLPGLI family protein [Allomuricauda taeanensis]SHK43842.1 GLPGLI family protein [Allomuricauda taeanensis]